jgi:valyl-tRNA synthetase
MLAPYPKSQPEKIDEAAERDVALAKEVVNAGRNLRAEMKLAPRQRTPLYISGKPSPATVSAVNALIRPEPLHVVDAFPDTDAPVAVAGPHRVMLHVEVDPAEERKRLGKEIAGMDHQIARTEAQLGNTSFLERAPAAVVEEMRRRLSDFRDKKAKLDAQLARLPR